MANKASIIYITAGSLEEAKKISRALLEAKLIACANIFPPMVSLYRWQGKIETSEEYAVILKTATRLLEQVTKEIKKLHSYQSPCIISLPIEGGSKEYVDWILESVKYNDL